ncbi:MAG: hypothetical protein ACOX2K_08515, partial [Bacillota bacterium]
MSIRGHRCPLSVHTDLALEAHEATIGTQSEQQGVRVTTEEFPGGSITRVVVENELGASRLGKPVGT